jgi:hypothetical protein
VNRGRLLSKITFRSTLLAFSSDCTYGVVLVCVSRPSTNYRVPQWKPKQIIQDQECILGSVEQPVPVKEENLIRIHAPPAAWIFFPSSWMLPRTKMENICGHHNSTNFCSFVFYFMQARSRSILICCDISFRFVRAISRIALRMSWAAPTWRYINQST